MSALCRCGCGRPAARHRLGLAKACHERFRYHGRPESFGPPSGRGNDGRRAEREEDYAELRSWGVPLEEAARRVGISERTAGNLERRYRHGGEPLPAEPAEVVAPERCCNEPRCRRTHPVLIRREGDRWYAITKYVLRLDGSLSITERHDITDEMERAC